MSTLCLQYPKKPQEVADDLESVVYILVRMALRFHRHNRSVEYPSGCQSPDVIQKINSANGQLCLHVSAFFDEEVECEDGYWLGGATKRDYLQSPQLPVELLPGPDGEETPLSALLNVLYALLRQHYGAVNYSDLERFMVSKKVKVKLTTVLPAAGNEGCGAKAQDNGPGSSTAQKPTKASKAPHPLSRVSHEWSALPLPRAGPSRKIAPKPISVITVENPKRVLDNHAEFFEAFKNAFFLDAEQRDLSIYEHDKWYDQFDGLKAAIGMSDKNPSGPSGKRKGDSEDEQKSYEGAQKRVRGSTSRMNVPRTVIEQPEPKANPSGALGGEDI